MTRAVTKAKPKATAKASVALTFHPLTLAGALLLAVLAAWAERRLENAPEFPLGLLVGEVAVLAQSTRIDVWNDERLREHMKGQTLTDEDLKELGDLGI